jgi:hypothetical protein
MNNLKKLYNKLPEGELNDVNLREIYNLLQDRRGRLRNRYDDYSTDIGKAKLTNNIYRDLENEIISSYRAIMLAKNMGPIDLIPSENTPFEDLMLYETIDEDTNTSRWDAVDLGAHLLRVDGWSGINNPYTHEKLSDATYESILQHPTWGQTAQSIRTVCNFFCDTMGNMSIIKYIRKYICDLSIQEREITDLREWLEQCTYNDFLADSPKIQTAFDDRSIRRNPELIAMFKHVSEIFQVLQDAADPTASGDTQLCLVDVTTLSGAPNPF